MDAQTPLKQLRSSLPNSNNHQARMKRTMTSKLENSVEEIENDEDATVILRGSQGKLSGQKSLARLGSKFADKQQELSQIANSRSIATTAVGYRTKNFIKRVNETKKNFR